MTDYPSFTPSLYNQINISVPVGTTQEDALNIAADLAAVHRCTVELCFNGITVTVKQDKDLTEALRVLGIYKPVSVQGVICPECEGYLYDSTGHFCDTCDGKDYIVKESDHD